MGNNAKSKLGIILVAMSLVISLFGACANTEAKGNSATNESSTASSETDAESSESAPKGGDKGAFSESLFTNSSYPLKGTVVDLPVDESKEAYLPEFFDGTIQMFKVKDTDERLVGGVIMTRLYQSCELMPEVLTSTVSAFPHLLQRCDIETDDPLEIEKLFNQEGGGKLQEKLLTELETMFRSDYLYFAAQSWNGEARYLGMRLIDESLGATPENMELYWRDGVFVDRNILYLVYLDDEVVEYTALDIDSGGARCYLLKDPD